MADQGAVRLGSFDDPNFLYFPAANYFADCTTSSADADLEEDVLSLDTLI
jgi:hypothetical protein